MVNEILLSVVFFFFFFTSLLSWASAQDGMTSGHLCPRLSSHTAGKGHDTRLTFLQHAPLGNFVLYLTVWTEDNRLVRCSVNSDPSITEEYLSLCKKEPDAHIDAAIRRFNISMLLSPDDNPCTREPLSVAPTAQRDDAWGPTSPTSEVKSRRKRSWFFPGTLWCGIGSRAMEYHQLGMFESADKCCREHDHCVHIIAPFTVNYGTFNTNIFTVSHCDCDRRFRQCLLGVNDTISNVVGYSFFNIFRVPCFNLVQQRQCTEMFWWGRCKVSKEAPYAVFQKPSSYDKSTVTSKPAAVSSDGGNSTCTEGCPLTDPTRKANVNPTDTSDPTPPRCRPREPPRGDTFQPRKRKGKACRKSRKQHPTASVPRQTTSVAHSTPATSLLKMPRVTAQLRPTRVVSSVVVSGGKQNASGLRVAYTSLATSKVIARTTTSSTTRSTTPVSQTKIFNPPVAVAMLMDNGLPRQLTTVENQGPSRAAATPVPEIKMSGILTGTTDTFWDSGNPPRHANKTFENTEPSLTGNLSHCAVLKMLDECKYRIPALEKKYGLQNMESKTIYHCDCIIRLANEIEHIKPTQTFLSLLVDFVSRRCFDLPKWKKCHKRKRCMGYFSEAPAVFQGLEQKVEKDTAAKNVLQDTKTIIPVRFYKRCLRTVAPGIRG